MTKFTFTMSTSLGGVCADIGGRTTYDLSLPFWGLDGPPIAMERIGVVGTYDIRTPDTSGHGTTGLVD